MVLDEAKFPLAIVAKAIDRNVSTTRTYLPHLVGGNVGTQDRPAAVPGATALYTARTALQLGIASRLVGFLSPPKACHAASAFTHLASTLEAPGFDRAPGELFEGNGIGTALVAYRTGDAAVVRFEFAKQVVTPFMRVFFPTGGLTAQARYDEAQTLFLDFLVKDITVRLEASEAA